jgi:hypothetical protein
MWNPIFNVNCGLSGKRPKVVAKIGVDEHGTRHSRHGEVGTLGDAVLRWRVLMLCALQYSSIFPRVSSGVLSTRKMAIRSPRKFSAAVRYWMN